MLYNMILSRTKIGMRSIHSLFMGLAILAATPVNAQDQPPPRVLPNQTETSSANPGGNLTPEELARQQREAEEAAGAACAVCGGSMAMMVIVFVAAIVLNIALLIWTVRDAKSRGMDSSVLWMFLVMLTGPLGLVIYLFSRPQGQLMQCQSCKGKRLSTSAKCPHCQNP